MSLPGYDFDDHWLHLDGLRLHYLDEGLGEPVVMLHGNPTWSFYYRHLATALRDSYRVIVPDHIGCGLSDKPDDSRYQYTLRRRAEDVETLLDRLGISENITLVVHDWGGMIGLTYASWHPERIKRLVILNTAAFHMPQGKPLPWQLKACRNPLIGPLLIRGLNAFSRGAVRTCVTRRRMPTDARQGYLAPYDSWANRIGVLRFVQDIPLQPSDPSYATVSEVEARLEQFRETPMLIGWGERDFVFDVDFLHEWTRRFPQAETHRFPDAGHYILEDAGEEMIPLVRQFLERHPLSTPSAHLAVGRIGHPS